MLATAAHRLGRPVLKSGAAAIGAAVVAVGLLIDGDVPGHGVGGERDAAADGDLLPDVHAARGLRLPAAGGLQSRSLVPARRRPRQAGADHGDGLGLQRRRRRRRAHHREPARAPDRHHHQQLRHLQRPLADADPRRLDLHRRGRAGALGRVDLGAGGGRCRGAGRGAHLRHVVAAVAHAAARRGLGVQPRAAAVPPAAGAGHALHVAHRSHALRAVARRRLRAAGRRGDLARVQHPLRRHQPGARRSSPGSSPSAACSACRA